jgi:mannosylglycoprotein endo-beta-mannosidase
LKRKASAIVLKLDFHKAFDSISWEALDRILIAKGFPSLFCLWIRNLNSSSQSAVILNGKPGNWIQCRRGLWQGDPLSPYLFNIVVDVLRAMLLQASVNGLLHHPIVENSPCPVLQYADDTIIIIRSSEDDIRNLKVVLDSFSVATGLQINFHKSTFAPIHVEQIRSVFLAGILGCPVATFPQTYLGLPLSTLIRLKRIYNF